MFSCKKNSYLQLLNGNVKPELLNRCVDKARNLTRHDPHDALPPLQRLCSHQPILVPEKIDFTRRKCGYGRIALSQLSDDLISYDPEIVMKAVSTLADMVFNPELTAQIIAMRIPQRMAHLLDKGNNLLTESICGTYTKLASTPDGKLALVKNMLILENLKRILQKEEDPNILRRLGKCLERISMSYTTADELVDQGFIEAIMKMVAKQNDHIVVLLLSTLRNLLYGNGKYIAMETGAFSTMIALTERLDHKVTICALNCLMVMTSTPLGKRMALDCDLLQTLTDILCLSENPELDAAITSVLMFCTVRSEAKYQASKIRRLVPRLMRLCRNPLQYTVQMFSLATLLNLSVHWDIKALLLKKYASPLKRIKCATSMISHTRDNLLQRLDEP
ncbi:hypothetical protein HHI36_019419 [Cryptolaemus montrouzieri]|uniref:Armadillo repeat-containing protein 8 n=1 Tax=Cryptolaemus montrouzieri TaxID=559131 RepID=A0ABD2P2Z7_9CUCU